MNQEPGGGRNRPACSGALDSGRVWWFTIEGRDFSLNHEGGLFGSVFDEVSLLDSSIPLYRLQVEGNPVTPEKHGYIYRLNIVHHLYIIT